MAWTYPAVDTLSDAVKVRDADNKIQHAMNDLQSWVNATGDYTENGFGVVELASFNNDVSQLLSEYEAAFEALIEDTLVSEW